MRHTRTLWCALVALALAVPAMAQAPPVPQPGPEHALLKADEGVWDATVEVILPPGTPAPPPSRGTETNTLMGGRWLVSDFKGDMMGSPFTGHGIAGWDPGKKKYVSVWTDSMSTSLLTGESTYDAASKTMTGWMEGPDMTGKVTKTKLVTEYRDADTRVFTMYGPGPDGKETPGLRITYKRRQ